MDVNNIEKKVWAYIKANNMLEDCSNAVVGVSGGADSVCLMIMLNDYIIPVSYTHLTLPTILRV